MWEGHSLEVDNVATQCGPPARDIRGFRHRDQQVRRIEPAKRRSKAAVFASQIRSGRRASREDTDRARNGRGEDSDIWSGLVGNPQGELQLLLLDSSPHGQPQVRAEYFVTSHECQEPPFSDTGNGAVRCRDHDMQ